jgi:hypothetical protein
VLLSVLLQECVSYFTVYMLLTQDTTITEQNMRIDISIGVEWSGKTCGVDSKVSVPIGTPILMKPSRQKEVREISTMTP